MTKRNKLLTHDELMAREPDVKRLQDAYALLAADPRRGVAELEELAGRGSVMSMLYLAQTFQQGPLADPGKTESWYRAAYEADSLNAVFGLGGFYYRENNYAEAEKVFREGASRGDGLSMYWSASVYTVAPGNTDRSHEIRDLLERSMRLGQVRAKNSLGFLFMKGRYGVRNIPRGVFLYLSSLVDGFRIGYKDPTSRRLM